MGIEEEILKLCAKPTKASLIAKRIGKNDEKVGKTIRDLIDQGKLSVGLDWKLTTVKQ